jgi:hypothetical protein
MEHLKIFNILESDIDALILAAGGERLSTASAERSSQRTADYRFNESVIELKLIDEEGMQKKERQRKISNLFKKNQPKSPVVIIHPSLLNETEKKEYYEIIEGPIKAAIKRANQQLKETSARMECPCRVLLIINNSYQALDAREFEAIVTRRTLNDTRHIDHVIIAGVYFYGDTFDSYAFSEFKLVPIHLNIPFPSYESLKRAWSVMDEDLMTRLIKEPSSLKLNRLPVVDIHYEYDNITYVKPPPPMGERSQFFRYGRPRINSSGLTKCPPVGIVIPLLDYASWNLLKNCRADVYELKDSYGEYITWLDETEKKESKIRCPIIKMPVSLSRKQIKSYKIFSFSDLCEFALNLFEEKVRAIEDGARAVDSALIEPISYMYLEIVEIGQDKHFDLASLWFIRNLTLSPTKEQIFFKERIFYEYGVMLAASYAIKFNTEYVIYKRDVTFGWV